METILSRGKYFRIKFWAASRCTSKVGDTTQPEVAVSPGLQGCIPSEYQIASIAPAVVLPERLPPKSQRSRFGLR